MTRISAALLLGLALVACGDKDETNGDGGAGDGGAGDGGTGDGGTGDGGTGDGGTDADCRFDACGGDPVGTWAMAGTCFQLEGNPYAEFCTDPALRFSMSIDASGTIDIRSDGQYVFDILFAMEQESFLPAACLPGLTDCDQLDSRDEEGGMDCQGAVAEGCSCVWSLSSKDQERGSWSVSGSTLRFDDGDGDVEEMDFCVQGGRATVGSALEDLGYFSYELSR